jgi:catechol 2,3-dioxygenase-like lactoylglutathione lyase family enzyme
VLQKMMGNVKSTVYIDQVMLSAGFHEIVLVVKDVEKAAQFYSEVIGLTLRSEPSEDWASFATIWLEHPQWLGLRKGYLLYEEYSRRPQGERFGPVHFALQACDPSPELFLQNAKKHGIDVYGPEKWKGRMTGMSYYCYDPDDNLVEYWYPCHSRCGPIITSP